MHARRVWMGPCVRLHASNPESGFVSRPPSLCLRPGQLPGRSWGRLRFGWRSRRGGQCCNLCLPNVCASLCVAVSHSKQLTERSKVLCYISRSSCVSLVMCAVVLTIIACLLAVYLCGCELLIQATWPLLPLLCPLFETDGLMTWQTCLTVIWPWCCCMCCHRPK